jgi:hypothetical protein
MKKTTLLILVATFGVTLSSARATTVIPPTFDELVGQADVIFQGDVTNMKSEWVGEGGQRHIVSYVTFKVEEVLKGTPGSSYTIRMLGGTVAGETMGVTDAPKFNRGDKDILFVQNNGSQFIPLVGIMHGRFHVRKNQAGEDVVTDHEDQAVKNVARFGRATSGVAANEADLSPADFKAAIRTKVEQTRAGQRAH